MYDKAGVSIRRPRKYSGGPRLWRIEYWFAGDEQPNVIRMGKNPHGVVREKLVDVLMRVFDMEDGPAYGRAYHMMNALNAKGRVQVYRQ